ncbi:MAG: hypothetical protein WD894_08525 [Pirellulales bacterium]
MLLLVICIPLVGAFGQSPTTFEPSDAETSTAVSAGTRNQPTDARKSGASTKAAETQNERPTERTPETASVAGDREKSEKGVSGSSRPPAVEELRPEVMYLRDKSGKLVPVPGFSYEDFLELLRLKQGPVPPGHELPKYSLQQALIEGETNGQQALLTARFDVQVVGSEWVQVPLGLGRVVLEGPIEYEGDGDSLIDYDEASRQYKAWLRGTNGGVHRLTLKLRAPLTAIGGIQKLSLSLPRAATSELSLRVPIAKVIASATPADLVPEVTTADGSSTINLLGIGGDFALTWSAGDRSAAIAGPVLESSGQVLIRIDGRSVTSDATLNVRSFGAAFERFGVRLPKGASLAGGPKPGYTVTTMDATSSLVEVKLDKPTLGPVEVNLVTERAFDITQPEKLELAGFEVIEAVAHRQGGQIGVVVTSDWQVVWENRSRVRQIDEPTEDLQRRDLLAAFEYVGQPYELTASVVPRQPRITVDPEYIYYVDAFQTKLEARLKYSIRGAKVFSLELDIPGWQVDEIGPASIVDLKSVVSGEDARMKLPFVEAMVGDVEITVRAHRSHSANPGDIELHLPVLKEAIVGPATVAIVPDDNVELATRTDQLVALSRQRAPATLRLPSRRQDSQIFRAERANAKYVAGLAVQPQKITVSVANSAAIGRSGVDVEQRFQYQVFYEPIDRLSFALPSGVAAANGIEMYVNYERIQPEVTADDQQSDQSLRMQLELPEPCIGSVEVVSRFHLPLDELRPATTVPLDIPLLMPLQGEFASNTLEVECATGMAAEVRAGSWKLIEPGKPGDTQFRLTAATAASTVPLSVVVQERPSAGAAVVERAWIQTWLADRSRQERAVFRISTAEPRISLSLPPEVDASELEALLDAQSVRPTLHNGNILIVALPTTARTHTLELRYPYLNSASGSSVALNVPDFGEGIPLRRLYWQLIVPRNQHLLMSSSNLTPEFRWMWEGLHWSRSNLLDQADLEDWTETLREPEAPELMNVYLFSVIGNGQSLTARIARRSTIVFIASSIALAVVLLALYAAPLRRPRWLMAIGVGLGVLALAYPEPAIVLAQAALLGVGLAVVAAVLHRVLPRDTSGDDLARLPSSAIMERSSTEVFHRQAPAATPSSTASVAVALDRSTSESQVR